MTETTKAVTTKNPGDQASTKVKRAAKANDPRPLTTPKRNLERGERPGTARSEDKPEDRDVGETAAAIADPGDHGRLLLVNGAVLGLGLVTRNGRLMRTGVRMVIAQGLAFGARMLFAHGLHTQGKETAEEASQDDSAKGAATQGDKDENDGVATGSSAATIAVAKAVSATSPIPYIPARIAGLAITGSDTPRKANVVSDFLLGAAIGWVAEKLATRLVGSGDDKDDRRDE